MAKHFKEEPVQSTAVMRKQRTAAAPRLNVEHTQGSLPYGQAATYRSAIADAAPTGEYFMGEVPARGGARAVGRAFLLMFAWLIRLCAIAMVLLVLLNALGILVLRPTVTAATDIVTSYLPWRSVGLLEVDTPFGGTFRGDLALIAVALFVVDWLLCRARASLR